MSERTYDVTRSNELYQRAGEIIPGWTQLISRRASQFANGVSPTYAQRAKGSRFIDVDGNEYIDWVNAVGAIILGHADPVVDTAVKEQIDRGSLLHTEWTGRNRISGRTDRHHSECGDGAVY